MGARPIAEARRAAAREGQIRSYNALKPDRRPGWQEDKDAAEGARRARTQEHGFADKDLKDKDASGKDSKSEESGNENSRP